MRPAVLAGVGAALAWSAPAPSAHAPGLAELLGIRLRLPRPHGVALTFDDGPHPEGTPAVLDALASAGAVATFFLVGEQVERWPDEAAAISEAGHEVALHGYRHRLVLTRAPSSLARDLDRAATLIAEFTGRRPHHYRPPYGVFSSPALVLAHRRGWIPFLWSRWGWDWSAKASWKSVARRAGTGLRAGDVVLLHDADHYSAPGSWRTTAAALPSVLEAVDRLGEPFVSLNHSM
jgi:peptidoglycan/xylan/chitin deacetylase (PgdA/CDA1 family)